MRVHLQNVQKICSAFLFPIFLLGTVDFCAGQELKTGGDAPVTDITVYQGDFQPVLKGPGQAEQDFLSAEYLFLQGRVFEAEKRERQAIQCYERACQYVSSDAILVSLVSLAVKQKRYDEAFRYFDKISNPSCLGISILDRLASCAARMDENERVVQTYRAILDSVPVNEAGPMRMLIHDRLGWAEYQAGNLDRALVSLRAVHSMLKEPQRFGIREEEQVLFEHSREINLLLLLDICITKKLADDAESILDELRQWNEKKQSVLELSEEEIRAELEEWRALYTYESARIAYIRKEAADALKLALEAYELGYEEEDEPYSLLDAILKTLGRENEALQVLKKIQKKQPDRTALKARIAQEHAYMALAGRETEFENAAKKSSDVHAGQAFTLYRELWSKNLERYSLQSMALALQLGECRYFEDAFLKLMKDSETDFGPTLLLEDLCGRILEEKEKSFVRKEKEEPQKAENASLVNESPSDPAQDLARTQTEEVISSSDLKEAVKKVLQDKVIADFAGQLFVSFGKEFEKVQGKEPNTDSKREAQAKSGRNSQDPLWATYGFFAVMAHQMKHSETALKFCSEAMAELKRTKITTRNRGKIVQFMLEVGEVLEEEEKLEMAEQHYRMLQSRIPGEVRFSVAHCYSLMLLGRFEEADVMIQSLLDRDPDNLEFIFLKANWLQQTQKYEEARTLLRDLLNELQDDYSAEFNRRAVSMIRNQMAVIEERLGNMEAAEDLMRSVLDEFPDDASAMNSLAYFWACEDRRLDRALQYSRESLKAEPGNPMYLDTLGWIYYRLGEFDSAYETLKEAAVGLEDPVVFSHLGDTVLALGQKEEAIQYFEKAMKQFKEAQQKNQDLAPRDLEHVEAQLKILKNS